MKVYLDSCCVNRPFDDLSQSRIREECEAVFAIIALSEASKLAIVKSSVLELEIRKTKDARKKSILMQTLDSFTVQFKAGADLTGRIKELETLGFKDMDAAHIACAEGAEADIFLTVDDRLLNRAQKNADLLHIKVANPVQWFKKLKK
jgi:predicted nucleic acid-binding protein